MASNVTLLSLRTRAKDRADLARSNFISDSEWNQYINDSATALYDMLVAKDEDYYTTSATVTADGSTGELTLPTNFYKLRGVDYTLGGVTQPMEKWVFEDRNLYQNNSTLLRYRVVKNKLVIKPTPSAQSFPIYYIPAFERLIADSDVLDGVNGWEDFVVVDAAIKAGTKEEQDITALTQEKMQIMKRIEDMGANRDQGKPERVTDVTGSAHPYMYGDF